MHTVFQTCELLENRPQANDGMENGMEEVTENLGDSKRL